MKYRSHEFGLPLSDQGAFFGYRWLAWVIAGLLLTLPGGEADASANHALLLLLLLAVNVTLTAIIDTYMTVARQRPLVLTIDLLIGVTVVLLSGGAMLPFFPYALGALILPALLFGWRGALIAGLGFVVLDQAGLLLMPDIATPSNGQLLVRVLIPLGFAVVCVLIHQFLAGDRHASIDEAGAVVLAEPSSPDQLAGDANPLLRLRERIPDRFGTTLPVRNPVQHSPAPAGLTPIVELSPQRRALYESAPDVTAGLPVALERVKQWLEQECRLRARVTVIGADHPLTAAQHQVLLRTAQEAALNIQQHARAQSVQFQLQFEPRAISLTISDDGVGLLDGTYERPGPHGLRLLRYRVSELDGQFAVFEREGGGLTVRTTLPL